MTQSPKPSFTLRGVALCMVTVGFGTTAAAAAYDLPETAVNIGTDSETHGSMRLPVGPWRDGDIAAKAAEGSVTRKSWRLDDVTGTTMDMLSMMRAQIVKSGFSTIYECNTQDCGGFDFRYGIDILPEPQMHVDLGDFRYLSAERQGKDGPEYLSLMVSKSGNQGFVQITEIGPAPAPAELAASTMSEPAASGNELPLDARGRMILDDLVFAPGKATLERQTSPALTLLAKWLTANPAAQIELVGYTDSQGSVAGNTTLSQKRAEAVRLALAETAGIDAARIAARGAGPSEPRADNATAEGRQKNRRVEVIFTPTR